MKKIILTLAVALSTMCSFAREANVTSTVVNAFNSDFANAREVTWTANRDYYKAAFIFNDQHVFAFYSTEGELIGTTRYISSLDLPVNLQSGLKKGFSNYWISDLFEISNSEGASYYITVENADTKIVLKSAGGDNWRVYQKTTKA